MPSSKKLAANRANAKRSTGPRTRGGRLRARLNALKHGLAVPASAHPALQHDIDQFARLLAGEAQHDPVVMVRALKVAEAAIEVQRARRARLELLRGWDLSTGMPKPVEPSEPMPEHKATRKRPPHPAQKMDEEEMDEEEMLRKIKLLESALRRLRSVHKYFQDFDKRHSPSRPPDQTRQGTASSAAWDNLIRQLERLERYERRARSRRDRAVKEFDSMKTKAMSI